MDFSDISWGSSKPGAGAAGGSGSNGGKNYGDSFADLLAKPKKRVENMSLQERQMHFQAQNKAKAQAENSTWQGLDLLSGVSSNNSSGVQSSHSSPGVDDNALDNIFDVFNKPPETVQKEQQQEQRPEKEFEIRSEMGHDEREQSEQFDQIEQEAFIESTKVPQEYQSQHKSGDVRSQNSKMDRAIAELMEMGFSDEQASNALSKTSNGTNVREAIDIIMNEAHAKSTGKPPPQQSSRSSYRRGETIFGEEGLNTQELSKRAQDISSKFLSTAGSFWNQGRKNLAKAIEQYNEHGGSDSSGVSTPAWMKKVDLDEEEQERVRATLEALKLEREQEKHIVEQERLKAREQMKATRARSNSGGVRSESRGFMSEPSGFKESKPESRSNSRPESRQEHRPAVPPSRKVAASTQQTPAQRFKSKALFDDDDTGYVSPVRRKTPVQKKPAAPSVPAAPVRESVTISSTALDMAMASRTSGNEAFKRGDYSTAILQYNQALESIPANHLLRTIVLSNRAACRLKEGDSRGALSDADEALRIIGPSMGVGETVENGKSLKDIWVKVVTKRGEAFEHMEKYQEALDAWNLLLNNGASTSVVLEAKRRCQAALAPRPKPKLKSANTNGNSGPTSAAGKAAVRRVQEAAKSIEKDEDERFALGDKIEEKIGQWKTGKEDNLRGLLGSLHTILWPELGWKQVSMAELVLPKKVKISYMKAVAKTHPDKVPATVTKEQQMIAQSVFITLNKAWDSFRESNGLS